MDPYILFLCIVAPLRFLSLAILANLSLINHKALYSWASMWPHTSQRDVSCCWHVCVMKPIGLPRFYSDAFIWQMRRQKARGEKWFAQGHAQLIIERGSCPNCPWVSLANLFSAKKAYGQKLNESSWKFLNLWWDLDPCYPTPRSLSSIPQHSLETTQDFSVRFHGPSQETVLKGTVEKASNVGIKGIKWGPFYLSFLSQQDQFCGRYFPTLTHSSGSLTLRGLRAESMIPEDLCPEEKCPLLQFKQRKTLLALVLMQRKTSLAFGAITWLTAKNQKTRWGRCNWKKNFKSKKENI